MIDIEKMSREETIRALRLCSTEGGDCLDCPLVEAARELEYDCFHELMHHAADVLEASVSVQYE